MRQKIEHNFPSNGNKEPKFYILTPDEIPFGRKYRRGPGGTLRTRFIQDASIKKKLFTDTDLQESSVLDTPARKIVLNNGLSSIKFPQVGRGGFGTVCFAIYNDELVACKAIKLNTVYTRNSFYREYNGLKLDHPNIVSTISIFRGPIYGMVVMEKAPKVTLQQYMLLNTLSDRLKLSFITQACLAVKYLHRLGVLHLDIKPLNMLIDEKTENLKLCDFGNSALKHGLGKPKSLGTVRYAAPEMFSSKKLISVKCDIYSLGISMWQIVMNKIPFGEDFNQMEMIYQITAKDLRPCPENHPFSNQIRGLRILQETYKKCWLPNPDVRPTLEVLLSNMDILKTCLDEKGRWIETGLELHI